MAFNGNFDHTLDAKNRLSLPARFRDSFPGSIMLTKDTDGCIAVSTAEAHDERVQRALEGANPLGREYRQIQRYFRGNSFEVELDSAGRITLPQRLREHAGIEKEVVIAGVEDHLELWSTEAWDAQQTALDEGIEEVIEGLGDPS
jgi:MraZ protein